MFDFPTHDTNAISNKMEEQISISYTVSRTKPNREHSTYNTVASDWEIHSNSNLISIPEKEELEEKKAIANYIHNNNLLQFIIECQQYIKIFFPEGKIKQELHIDPEEGYPQLFLLINTSLSVKNAFKQSRKMFKNWDLPKNPTFNKYVTIATRSV